LQAPAWQVVPPTHRFPQVPQFALSVCSSTQAVPQDDKLPEHITAQLPFVQIWFPMHFLPHAPQSLGFDCKSTQAPLHKVWLTATSRSVVAPQAQAPATQCNPAPHALPQAPQLVSSVCKSAQAPLQLARPAPH
jgi:hypothetical protein